MYYGSGTGGRCCICAGRRSRHSRDLKSMTSKQKSDSVNGCVFISGMKFGKTWRTILPNYIPIRF